MATKTISQLTAVSTPLKGDEIVPLVQAGVTSRTTISEISPKVSSSADVVNVNTSTTQTSLVSLTLPASALGDVFQLKAWGTITNNTGGNVTYTFTDLFNGSSLLATSATSLATSANLRKWAVDITIVVSDTTTSTASHSVSLLISDALNTGIPIQTLSGGGIKAVGDTRTTSVDLGVAGKTLSLAVTMGTSSATAITTCDGYVFTRIR